MGWYRLEDVQVGRLGKQTIIQIVLFSSLIREPRRREPNHELGCPILGDGVLIK